MAHRAIAPAELEWLTRPHEPGEPARHVAALSEPAQFAHTRELQTINHGDEDLLLYAYGTPPESERAEILESAV